MAGGEVFFEGALGVIDGDVLVPDLLLEGGHLGLDLVPGGLGVGALEVGAGGLEAVEHGDGFLDVDAVVVEGLQDVADGDLDAVGGLDRSDLAGDGWRARGLEVVIAEDAITQRRRAAANAVGADVLASRYMRWDGNNDPPCLASSVMGARPRLKAWGNRSGDKWGYTPLYPGILFSVSYGCTSPQTMTFKGLTGLYRDINCHFEEILRLRSGFRQPAQTPAKRLNLSTVYRDKICQSLDGAPSRHRGAISKSSVADCKVKVKSYIFWQVKNLHGSVKVPTSESI